ncbi:CAP domain-containing protein [Neobacillus dielmonensis]|uniref:CAP domain-containing protein n=1 Tax=Neobacillus dielmonensis TaxID=1347369 RepID=UPI000B33121B|nr:CAP domain-containing protein [Neobacillus dielmonensis]
MIKKPVSIVLTALLSLGLAACNNNDNNDAVDQNRLKTTNRDNRTNMMDVRNRRDNGIDHNGPLTEDYNNNDNNDPDFDANLFNNRNKNKKDHDDTISAYQTTLNSSQYPHTRAVLMRDAKYQFIQIDPRQFNLAQPAPQQAQPAPQQAQPAPQQAQPAPQQAQPAPQQAQPAPQQAQPAPQQTKSAPQQAQANTATSATVSQYVKQVIELTNQQRSKNGVPALKEDTLLSSVAQKKAVDMQQNHYFSHTSPTYGSPFDMMRDFGVTYKSAGENIAQGQRTPQEVVNAWMNSEGHRKNILSPNFTHIGVGFEESGKQWSQMFIGK